MLPRLSYIHPIYRGTIGNPYVCAHLSYRGPASREASVWESLLRIDEVSGSFGPQQLFFGPLAAWLRVSPASHRVTSRWAGSTCWKLV